jgi:hypothetical protein
MEFDITYTTCKFSAERRCWEDTGVWLTVKQQTFHKIETDTVEGALERAIALLRLIGHQMTFKAPKGYGYVNRRLKPGDHVGVRVRWSDTTRCFTGEAIVVYQRGEMPCAGER